MPLSYETAAQIDGVSFDVEKTRDVLNSASSPEVIVTVFMRAIGLGEAQLATAAGVSGSSIRAWRNGKQPSVQSLERLQALGTLTAYLLSFDCFTTPQAVGRWLSMPRLRSDQRGHVTALVQVAEGKLDESVDDAYAMLAGPVERSALGVRRESEFPVGTGASASAGTGHARSA